jgi:serine/threonine-protein kinase
LQGRELWNRRTPAAFVEALREFERAVALAPARALPYSGLADTHSLLYAYGIRTKEEALPVARAAAEKGLSIDANLGELHASMSYVLWEEGRRAEAMTAARRAIALNPNYATARHWYALFLQDSGHFVEAIHQAQAAQALAPSSPIIGADLSIMLRSAGRRDEARELLTRLIAAHPTYPQLHVELAELYRRTAHYDLALKSIREAVRLGDDRPMLIARMGWLEARQGNLDAARWAARHVKSLQDQGVTVLPELLAEVMGAAGDVDRAYQVLDEGMRARQPWILVVTSDELYEPIRTDPRWPGYAKRLRDLGREMQSPPVIQPPVM